MLLHNNKDIWKQSVIQLYNPVTYPEVFRAHWYTHWTHEGATMVGAEWINFQNLCKPNTLKMHSLALFVLSFLCKIFFKLLKLSLRKILFRLWFFKVHMFKQKTIFLTVSSFASTSLSRCFSLLSPFFVLSYLEIIRCIVRSLIATLKCFLLKYNWKNKTWKMFFCGARVWVPKQVNQMAWIHHWNLAKLRKLKK